MSCKKRNANKPFFQPKEAALAQALRRSQRPGLLPKTGPESLQGRHNSTFKGNKPAAMNDS